MPSVLVYERSVAIVLFARKLAVEDNEAHRNLRYFISFVSRSRESVPVDQKSSRRVKRFLKDISCLLHIHQRISFFLNPEYLVLNFISMSPFIPGDLFFLEDGEIESRKRQRSASQSVFRVDRNRRRGGKSSVVSLECLVCSFH